MVGFDQLYDQFGKGSEPIPVGEYDFVVVSSEAKKTQNGKDMFRVQCKVESGPHVGRSVWNNFTISPESDGAMQWFFSDMRNLGLGQDFWRRNPGVDQVAEALVNRRFRGTVKITEYQGQERNEIERIKAPRSQGGADVPPPPIAAAAPAPPPPPPPPAPAPVPAAPPAAPAPVAETPPPPPPPPAPVPVTSASVPPPPPLTGEDPPF